MGFKAVEAVQALDFDLSPHGPEGTLPEPSDGALRKFRRGILEIAKKGVAAEGGDNPEQPTDTRQALTVLANLDLDQIEGLEDDLARAVAGVADGSPSREEIDALPARVKQFFCNWVAEELLNPQTPATTGSRAAQSNGASTAPSASATS